MNVRTDTLYWVFRKVQGVTNALTVGTANAKTMP